MDTPDTQQLPEMAKAYEAQRVEQRLYAWWERSGFFTPPETFDRPPFVISMPPPAPSPRRLLTPKRAPGRCGRWQ